VLRAEFCPTCNEPQPVVRVFLRIYGKARKVDACGKCREPFLKQEKFRNVPTRDATGKMRQSKKEATRGSELLNMQRAGEISGLRFCNDHPRERFILEVFGTRAVERLLQAIDEADPGAVRRCANEVRRARFKLTTYTPDFSYADAKGVRKHEDAKGYRTPEFRMKKRLLMICHEIEVEES
jgi:hypothetical protein